MCLCEATLAYIVCSPQSPTQSHTLIRIMDENKSAQLSSHDQTPRHAHDPNMMPGTGLPAAPTSMNNDEMLITSIIDPKSTLDQTDMIQPYSEDPYALKGAIREDITKRTLKQDHPGGRTRKLRKYYNRQNALIDAYLGSLDEEAVEVEDNLKNGGKVKFAVYGSSTVNFFLFIIQMYAAVSTGSLALFGTAADAFMDLISSIVMLITTKLAATPNVEKFPVVSISTRLDQDIL